MKYLHFRNIHFPQHCQHWIVAVFARFTLRQIRRFTFELVHTTVADDLARHQQQWYCHSLPRITHTASVRAWLTLACMGSCVTLSSQWKTSALWLDMMTSTNGNIFRVTSHLCGEFSAQRPVTWSFHVFFDLRLNKPLSKPSLRLHGDLRRYRAHYDVIVMERRQTGQV